MNIKTIFLLLSFLLLVNYNRFGGSRSGGRQSGGRHANFRRGSSNSNRGNFKQSRGNSRNHRNGSGSRNWGGNHNNFNGYAVGGYGNAGLWGLGGGMMMGLFMGAALSSNNNNGPVTVINSYEKDQKNKTENYEKITQELNNEINEISKISEKIASESKKIDIENQVIPSYIKLYFEPYHKIKIENISSNIIYGDGSDKNVQIANFTGNQEIIKEIQLYQPKIKYNIEKLSQMNNSNSEKMKRKLINTLKEYNMNIVETVKKLQKIK